jgi:hypothetical protein
MAHFAKLDEKNKILSVEVVVNEVITDENNIEQEQLGIDFLENLHGGGWYKQASYNGTFRKNFPGEGGTYDTFRDAFIGIQPYNSWILNESTCKWEAPVTMLDDGKQYQWDESE